jgi:hypothetical protein
MAVDLDTLKLKRDQLNAQIQKAESRLKANQKKEEDRVKVLVGAALLNELKTKGTIQGGGVTNLLSVLDGFLTRPAERTAILGERNRGSEALQRVLGIQATDVGERE